MKSYAVQLLAMSFCTCMMLSCSHPVPAELVKEGIKADDMKRIETIQPGSTREDLLRVFDTTGGISGPSEAQFRYKEHRDVAVDVKFQCQRDEMGRTLFLGQDRIISISPPYYSKSMIGD